MRLDRLRLMVAVGVIAIDIILAVIYSSTQGRHTFGVLLKFL